jgi:3-dehydro-L-gulonate 2-dehydrogenase
MGQLPACKILPAKIREILLALSAAALPTAAISSTVTAMSNVKTETILIPHEKIRDTLYVVLRKFNVPEQKAKVCSEVFTRNSLEGVYSHGVNRFPRFIGLIERGIISVDKDAVCAHRSGAMEQWHGQSGFGITNAISCTERAVQLATENGIGCVAVSHTNHWMRAGTYARIAAEKGCAFVAWSNTIKNTPAWGSTEPRLGNNPLAIGIPFNEAPIVLDMAMSQYSYGALEEYKMNERQLPVAGGFDESGKLTTDPVSILKSRRTLPIGYWKGSSLSLMLDILAATLSNGLSVSEISKQSDEANLSQVFIAFNLKSLSNAATIGSTIQRVIDDLKQSALISPEAPVRYPGESVGKIRSQNLANGIPMRKGVWEEILKWV